MNRTQKLLEVARWVYPHHTWTSTLEGRVGCNQSLPWEESDWEYFDLSDRKTRQDTLLKLREHGWIVEQKKGYWLGYTRDGLKVETPTLEALVWDLVGRVG